MKILLKTICEKAFHTQEGGNLNIMGIFENISATQFPVRHLQMAFVFIIEGSPGQKIDYYFDITSFAGKRIFDTSTAPAPQTFEIGDNGKIHLIVNLQLVEFIEPDLYSANFYFGKEKMKESIAFNVQLSNKT